MASTNDIEELREDAQKALLRAIRECAGQHDAKRAQELADAYASVTQAAETPDRAHSA